MRFRAEYATEDPDFKKIFDEVARALKTEGTKAATVEQCIRFTHAALVVQKPSGIEGVSEMVLEMVGFMKLIVSREMKDGRISFEEVQQFTRVTDDIVEAASK